MIDENSSGGFIGGVICTIVIISIFWGIGSNGKYEGQTAKEWYGEYIESEANYDSFFSCVEQFAISSGSLSSESLYSECF